MFRIRFEEGHHLEISPFHLERLPVTTLAAILFPLFPVVHIPKRLEPLRCPHNCNITSTEYNVSRCNQKTQLKLVLISSVNDIHRIYYIYIIYRHYIGPKYIYIIILFLHNIIYTYNITRIYNKPAYIHNYIQTYVHFNARPIFVNINLSRIQM